MYIVKYIGSQKNEQTGRMARDVSIGHCQHDMGRLDQRAHAFAGFDTDDVVMGDDGWRAEMNALHLKSPDGILAAEKRSSTFMEQRPCQTEQTLHAIDLSMYFYCASIVLLSSLQPAGAKFVLLATSGNCAG